jgi:protein phosphatase
MGFLRRIFRKGGREAEKPPESGAQTPEAGEALGFDVESSREEPQETLGGDGLPAAEYFDDTPGTTDKLPDDAVAAPELPLSTTLPLNVGYASHAGHVRQRNEDSILMITSTSLGDSALPPFGMFIVADGMGGHSDGHRASQMAARMVAREVMGQVYAPYLRVDPADAPGPIQEVLVEALRKASSKVRAESPESGTTLTAALVLGTRMSVAHVGDSRVYLINGGGSEMELLTVDHSYVRSLQDAGQLTHEEAASHPQKNILYRAIGQEHELEVDTFTRALQTPSWLLLCSDGLWGVVPPETILAAASGADGPQQACNTLVRAALDAGGPDNISLILVRLE